MGNAQVLTLIFSDPHNKLRALGVNQLSNVHILSGTMKKILLLTIILISVSLAQTTPEDYGCKNMTYYYLCPEIALIDNLKITLTSNITCISTDKTATCVNDCAPIIDYGCMATVKINEPFTFERCYYSMTNDTLYENKGTCASEILDHETYYVAMLDPSFIDYSLCNKYVNDSVYRIDCPYYGKELTINGSIDEEGIVLMGFEVSEKKDITAWIAENIIYLALIALTLIVFAWATKTKGGKKK